MKVAVTGASGFVGARLCERLHDAGHGVRRLVRRAPQAPDEVRWDPKTGEVDLEGLAGVEGVVHLAGENIAGGRWTAARKQRLRDSRVEGTTTIARALAKLDPQPAVLVSASAIGIYGSRGDERLAESSSDGDDFLAKLCKDWEAAAEPAREAGIRVAHPRIGLVLHKSGGALGKMLLPFKMCLGGPLGDGSHWMSWITREDLCSLLITMLEDERYEGPINAVAPGAVTNRDFTKALGRALGRPAIIPMPAFQVRFLFGEMGEALLLGSQRVEPQRALERDFPFSATDIDAGLAAALA